MVDTQVSLENTRKVEAPEIDLMPYVGRRVRIAGVTEHRSSFKDRESYYIRVVTETVGMIGPKPLVGSRNFGLGVDGHEQARSVPLRQEGEPLP
jgi:hypothetical protein